MHCKAQPAWEEMQRVCLFFSGILTISIKESLSNFKRNLTSSEIISQLWLANYYEDNSERISNVVFMGMGEPLMNTENVLKTIQIMQDQKC